MSSKIPTNEKEMAEYLKDPAQWCLPSKRRELKPGEWIPVTNKQFDAIVKGELDPNGIDAKTPGAKLDHGKTKVSQGVLQYFPHALKEVANVSEVGARKYSWKGWESVPDGINRYTDALGRHLLAEAIEGEFDRDTGLLHAAQVCWNSLARLELILREKEKHALHSSGKT